MTRPSHPYPARLGAYEVLGLLGAGGMGQVYRARDSRLGRDIAIKVLPPDVAASPERLTRLEREARTVAGLNHPNIVTLYSIEDHDGVRFLTMELVEGQNLSALVVPGGMPLPLLLEVAIPLTEALVAAHERGVVHRDLKPGNVMVARDGRLKVLDFGLSQSAEDAALDVTRVAGADDTPTRPAPVEGTIPYMSPEQVRGAVLDARSDLFSLGVILYEVATGRRPFQGESAPDLSSSILRDKPRSLAEVRPDLPADLDRIVSRCLEKNPRDRAQTALDVSNDLRRLRRALEHGDAAPARPPGAAALATVAVLPFVNRSGDEEDEYFSDGLADELLTVLAKIPGLRVAARSSSFQFKGSKDDLATIGRKLGVATVLEGTVRRSKDRVRIAVHLANVADGYQLWSETYDRTLDDIFAVQDDIARSVVKELRATLLGEALDSDMSAIVRAEVANAVKGRGVDPEAQRLLLLARHFLHRYTRDDLGKAIGHLREALDRDPTYAAAWAELTLAYCREADLGWAPLEEGYRLAREAARRSLALEPDLAEGHAWMGWIHMYRDWNWTAAEASYRRALELAPGSVSVLRGAGDLARNLGRLDDAIGLYHRALDCDPLSSPTYRSLGYALQALGRPAEAETAYRRALDLAPERVAAHSALAYCLFTLGRAEEGMAEALREPHEAYRSWAVAILEHEAGHREASDRALETMVSHHRGTMAYQIAEVHAARGETDLAFAWLERAYAQHDGGLASMRISQQNRPLHADPRWPAFLAKMGFAV